MKQKAALPSNTSTKRTAQKPGRHFNLSALCPMEATMEMIWLDPHSTGELKLDLSGTNHLPTSLLQCIQYNKIIPCHSIDLVRVFPDILIGFFSSCLRSNNPSSQVSIVFSYILSLIVRYLNASLFS